jgi:hypothetical protein
MIGSRLGIKYRKGQERLFVYQPACLSLRLQIEKDWGHSLAPAGE